MRFTLHLRPISDRQALTFNYQYPIQAWIYRLLANADKEYASFLHQQGYDVPDSFKTFKHFTFSSLDIQRTDPVKKGDDHLVIRSEYVFLSVSFLMDKAAESFVVGLFQNQRLWIDNTHYRTEFIIERVETQSVPVFDSIMSFRVSSPMVVASKKNGVDQYLSPADDDFASIFALNLFDKYRSISKEHHPQLDAQAASRLIQFRLLSDPERIKKRGFTVKDGQADKQTKVIGYHHFSFEITAPPQMIEVGYWSGFGRHCAVGCGMVEID